MSSPSIVVRKPAHVALLIVVLVGSAGLSACGTTTSSKPKPKAAPSTTSTAPCTPVPSHASQGAAQLTVDPGTCLTGGQVVTITGSGLKPNSQGGLAQCNSASQPTVTVAGSQVPVSCTNPLAQAVMTTSTGTLAATFTIITGFTGPPASGTDSVGRSALTDARDYPCPPTASQAAAGASCTLAFGDAGGDQLSANLSFEPHVKPTATEPGSTLTTSIPIG